ncbi:MAG TPA: hypothetical protein VN937_19450 [Blastocatellia bacterium]|nr:hypothetical protein [Blastocatellia bacterium]
MAILAAALLAPFPGTRANPPEAKRFSSFSKPLDCGYDARGAEDELSNHKLHALRRGEPDQARSVSFLQKHGPSVEGIDDIALLQNDGTLVIPPAKFNLKNRSILFSPEGGSDNLGYRISMPEIEFNNDFGSRLDFFGSDGEKNSDNGYLGVSLDGNQFPFYGVSYDTFFVGTNGYITFAQGDTSARISPSALATELPRIAPLWADLQVSDSGNIYYNRLQGARLFTWNKAGQPSYDGASTFQAVLYDDGRIAFVYKKVNAQAALVGISPGNSATAAQPVDFLKPPAERFTGPLFETFAKDKRLDLPAILRAFYSTHSDSFDTVYVWTNFAFDNGVFIAHTFNISNNIQGIGLPIFDRGPAYGSAHLGSLIAMGNTGDWPKNPDSYMVGLNSAISIVCHEQGHLWLAYIHFDADNQVKDDLLGRQDSHWSFLADTRTSADGGYSSLMEGNSWRESGGGIFTTFESAVNYFTPLDQYLMGLRPANEVGDIPYLVTDPQLKEFLHEKSPASGFSMSAVRKTASVAQIIAREGPRIPDVTTSPKVFRVAFVALSEQGSTISSSEFAKISAYRDAIVRYFSTATGGRGSLDPSLNGAP